jgi:hypothetical protein
LHFGVLWGKIILSPTKIKTMTANWKIAIGTTVSWQTSGQSSNTYSGVVLAHCPTGISIKSLGYKVSPTTFDTAKVDRYIIELHTKKPGKTKLKTPLKGVLEKQVQ